MKTALMAWLKDFLLVGFLVALMFIFAKPSLIYGESMLPTLEPFQLVFSERITLLKRDPMPGDVVIVKTQDPIVVFGWQTGLKKNYVKRVIAVPGDKLYISEYNVFLNNQLLQEPYTLDGITPGDYYDTIPENHYFVMGDNRRNSKDSRNLGPIPRQNIIGHVYLRLWPFTLWNF